MRKGYWNNYYKNHREPIKESSFARFISEYLLKNNSLIELGCGNGRDSTYFSNLGLKVMGVDQCEEEISHLNKKYRSENLFFSQGDFTRLPLGNKYNYIYSRFTLHSIDASAEDRTLKWAASSLKSGGFLFIEARSLKDEMFCYGKKISNCEAITDHYRRFIDIEQLEKKIIKNGLSIAYLTESNGLAIHKNEDPVVIRIIAKND